MNVSDKIDKDKLPKDGSEKQSSTENNEKTMIFKGSNLNEIPGYIGLERTTNKEDFTNKKIQTTNKEDFTNKKIQTTNKEDFTNTKNSDKPIKQDLSLTKKDFSATAKKDPVSIPTPGIVLPLAHACYPNRVRCGGFDLLPSGPGPFHLSLLHLDSERPPFAHVDTGPIVGTRSTLQQEIEPRLDLILNLSAAHAVTDGC
ncbi:hypothetical protein ACOME3_000555 [Neoechinorhynchus agilis]